MIGNLIEKGTQLLGSRVEVEPDWLYQPREARRRRKVEQALELHACYMEVRLKVEGSHRMLMDLDAEEKRRINSSPELKRRQRFHLDARHHLMLPSISIVLPRR